MDVRSRWLSLVLGLVLGACGNGFEGADGGDGDGDADTDADTDADADADSDSDTDTGPDNDPCAGNALDAPDLFACNGPPLGPQCDGEHGGECVFSLASERGTCSDDNGRCWNTSEVEGERGICLIPCPKETSSRYVSSGGCPTGTRCFDVPGLGAYCFPACEEAANCNDICDFEGSCVSYGGPVLKEEPAGCAGDSDSDTDADTDTDTDTDTGTDSDTDTVTDSDTDTEADGDGR